MGKRKILCYTVSVMKGELSMQLYFNKRDFSWSAEYEVFDSRGKVAYRVTGGGKNDHVLHVVSADGKLSGEIRENVSPFFAGMSVRAGKLYLGKVKRELSFWLMPRIAVVGMDWHAQGNIPAWQFSVQSTVDGRIASAMVEEFDEINRCYIDVEREEDDFFALLVMLAMEAEEERRFRKKMGGW